MYLHFLYKEKSEERIMAKIVTKSKTSLGGLLTEIFGFIVLTSPFWGVVSFVLTLSIAGLLIFIIGLTLMIFGFIKSFKTVCSECRNSVEDKQVKMCPVCKVNFE